MHLQTADLPLQAAVELFPVAGISPLTAETHRQWMGSEPQRVKVRRKVVAIAASAATAAALSADF